MQLEREVSLYSKDAILKKVTSFETSLDIIQGKISSIVSEAEMTELTNGDTTFYSKYSSLVQTADSISSTVSSIDSSKADKSNLISQINQSAETVAIKASKIELEASNLISIINSGTTKIDADHLTLSSKNVIEVINSGTTTIDAERLNITGADVVSILSASSAQIAARNLTLEANNLIEIINSGGGSAVISATCVDLTGKADASDLSDLSTKYANLTQTVNGLTSTVNDKLDTSTFTQKANSIEATVASKADASDLSDLSTKYANLTQTVNGLTSTVNDKLDTSTFTQKANSIEATVASKADASTLIAQINLSSEAATIDASRVNLSGYVTISNLATSGSTAIDGGNITTGTISADRLDVNAIFAKNITATGTITGATLSGATGTIGCWTFTADRIYDNQYSNGYGAGINRYGPGYAFWAGGSDITGTTAPFHVGHDGALRATNADITGTATITSGKIGSWTLDGNAIYNVGLGNDNSSGIGLGTLATFGYAFWAGNGAFYVTPAGSLYSTDASVSGSITATSLKIKDSFTMYGDGVSEVNIATIANNENSLPYVTLAGGCYALYFGGKYGSFGNVFKNDGETPNWSLTGDVVISKSLLVNSTLNVNGTTYFAANLHTVKSLVAEGTETSDNATANIRMNGSGRILYVKGSSSIRYKDVISLLSNDDVESLYDIPVYWFKYKDGYLNKTDERDGTALAGFIVEDWDPLMPFAIEHNEDGSPEMWNVNVVVPLMFQMIKNNHTQIELLKDIIKSLEEKQNDKQIGDSLQHT